MSDMWDEKTLRSKNIGWRFPSTDGGVQEGFNDPAAENFTKGISSLTREVIQNSLDAVNNTDEPVHIRFSCTEHSTKEIFPFAEEYIEHLKRCADSPSNKTSKILEYASLSVKSPSLYVLKISDYNTLGLSNPLNQDPALSSFTSLLKGSGISGKNGEEGGSFGLGKTAPFMCSEARAVFYFSQNIDGERAFQGKSILASHKWEENGVIYNTRNVGFFGNIDRDLTPLTKDADFKYIPSVFTDREEAGTDIFVMGFSRQDDLWDRDIEMSVLENFFIAIDKGQLICSIEQSDGEMLILDKASLPERMQEYSEIFDEDAHAQYPSFGDPDKNFLRYYYAYKEGKVFESEPGSLIEGSELHVLPISSLPDYLQYRNIRTGRTRQLFVRKLGMKVYEKQRDSLSPSIVVFIAHGTSLNNILQKCEPPAHNKWDYTRLPGNVKRDAEKKRAKECLDAISRWIAECLKNIKPVAADEFDVAGVSDHLAVGNDETQSSVQIEIQEKSRKRKPGLKLPSTNGKVDEEGEMGVKPRKLVQKTPAKKEAQTISPISGTPASLDSEGEPGAVPETSKPNNGKGGEPHTNPNNDNRTSEDEHGHSVLPKKEKKRKTTGPVPIKFKDLRTVGSPKTAGQYTLMFTPLTNVINGRLSIRIAGDTDVAEAKVTDVSFINGEFGQAVTAESGSVHLRNIPANKKVRLLVTLDYKERASVSISLEDVRNE